MSSTQQTFLIVNGLIVTLVVLSFFLMRKGPRPPVKLDLSAGKSSQPPEKAPTSTTKTPAKPAFGSDYRPRRPQPQIPNIDQDGDTSPGRAPRGAPPPPRSTVFSEADTNPGHTPREEVSLNVLFNWNGHTWDAYEVLGLPAGSSRDKVTAAFQAARAKADPESVPFLQAAVEAILRS